MLEEGNGQCSYLDTKDKFLPCGGMRMAVMVASRGPDPFVDAIPSNPGHGLLIFAGNEIF